MTDKWEPKIGKPIRHGDMDYVVTGIWHEQKDGEPEQVTVQAVASVPYKRIVGFRP